MRQRGFTFIEVMIAIVILAIVGKLVLFGTGANSGNISFGLNGLTESRCIEGYKFVIGEHGQPRQILDELGKGVRCYSNPDPGKPGSFGSNL